MSSNVTPSMLPTCDRIAVAAAEQHEDRRPHVVGRDVAGSTTLEIAEPSTDSTAMAAACALSMMTFSTSMFLNGADAGGAELHAVGHARLRGVAVLTVTFCRPPVALPLFRQMESSPLAMVQFWMSDVVAVDHVDAVVGGAEVVVDREPVDGQVLHLHVHDRPHAGVLHRHILDGHVRRQHGEDGHRAHAPP